MENENTNEKKKQIRLAIIGVVALLLLTLGATYAFFQINTDNSTSKSNIKGNISKAGVATLVPGTSNLHINLSSADMAEAKQGTEYYGDELVSNPYVLSEEDGTHTISQVQITDGEETTKYSCTAKVVVTMEITEDNNMGSVLQPGDLILQFKGNIISEKLDLSEIKESGTKTYDLSFRLKGNTTEDIQAYIKLLNKEEPQNYLANKNLKIDIKTEELSCDIFTPNTKLIADLREKSDGKLTTELVNGLYRYQGNSIVTLGEYGDPISQDTVNNNYICLGSDCSSAESDDIYRIIGINEDGEIKVIKSTPLNDRIEWNSDSHTDIQWPDSNMINYLNTDFYQTLPVELKEKIVNATWYYGDVTDTKWDETYQNIFTPEELVKYNELIDSMNGDDESELNDDQKREKIKEVTKMYSEALVKREKELTDNVNANIGLMNLTDYCSSFESNGTYNCITSKFAYQLSEEKNEDFGISWLTPSPIDTSYYDDSGGFLLSRYGNSMLGYLCWYINFEGYVSDRIVSTSQFINPVFFLTSDIELSGEGTIDSPFTIGIE